MLRISRFTHVFELGDAVALYHSLRMKPVFLTRDNYKGLQEWLASPCSITENDAPSGLKDIITHLKKYKVLTTKDDEDEKVLSFVRSKVPIPRVSVCYMILSEQCNLACKYCFLGNNDSVKRSQFNLQSMTTEVADKAVDFFIRQMKNSGLDSEENKPVVIFYGGEPLVNYPTLVYIAEKFNSLRAKEKCIHNLDMSMVTNGLLLDDERILKLKALGVGIGISVDGFTEAENQMRVDLSGKPVFSRVLNNIKRCQELGADVSLSVTLSEETIKHREHILDLVQEYGIRSFGFNIMMSSDTFLVSDEYNEAASQFIIDSFIELRKLGIYEDRIMRKLNAFSKSQIYFSDCAATSGGQIVVAPDGSVGICHGCLHDKKYFVADVFNDDFDCTKDPTYIEWAQLSPVNRDDCLDCPALGICGGGCPINAMYLKPENDIHSIDTRFCVHAKKTLEFLINDLYRVLLERRSNEK